MVSNYSASEGGGRATYTDKPSGLQLMFPTIPLLRAVGGLEKYDGEVIYDFAFPTIPLLRAVGGESKAVTDSSQRDLYEEVSNYSASEGGGRFTPLYRSDMYMCT